MTQDRINIVEPNGVERTRPISLQGLTIGRGADNDLTLAYDLISRYHAQITYEGGRYYVTDLNSANGTYIDRDRLTPNMPTLWPAGRPLQIGKVIIYLEQVAQPQPQPVETGETVVGQMTDDTLFRIGTNQKKRQVPLVLGITIGVILLCFLITLLTGIYFFAP
jgi:pSer/pThr/pTyr-binding forkhead associated (FHA) protein